MAIVLVRIDDRLIHGQITTAWIAESGASRIVISSDEVRNDPLQQTIISVTAPPRTPVEILSAAETIGSAQTGAWERERVFILCKYPSDVLPLVKAGLPFKEINVGNVGGMTQLTAGKQKQIFKSIAVTEQDLQVFHALLDAGIKLDVRVTPRDRHVDFAGLLAKA